MDGKLEKLASLCLAGVALEYRQYSNYYETLKDRVTFEGDGDGEYDHASNFLDGELDGCLETDKYWCLHFYPHTPVGFYHAFSRDLNKLLDWALDIVEAKQ